MASKKPNKTAKRKETEKPEVKADETKEIIDSAQDVSQEAEEKTEEKAEDVADQEVNQEESNEENETETSDDEPTSDDSEDEDDTDNSNDSDDSDSSDDSEEQEEEDSDSTKNVEKQCVATVEETPSSSKDGLFKRVFRKKHDNNENILNIFHTKKIFGSLIAEFVGTMVITLVFLSLGVYQPLYSFLAILGVTGLTFSLSGANLNPLITVGMMASRRTSAIRGVLYILSQILGAWIGYVIISSFVTAGGNLAKLPVMATIADGAFWTVTLIELFGSVLLAFFFARALEFKKNPIAFSGLFAGAFAAVSIIVIVISSNFLELSNNFMMNPAVALMYQILPTGGDSFADVLANVGLALATYVVFPMVGGWFGFFVSDLCDELKAD